MTPRGHGVSRFDPRTGTLVATPDALRALVAGRPTPPLLESGAIHGTGRCHAALRDVLDAMRDPCNGTLRLAYKGRSLDGWRGRFAIALMTPADAFGHHTLLGCSWSSLPAAIARAAGLRRRPRPAPGFLPSARFVGDRSVVRWWQLVHGPSDRGSGGLLEVIDTVDGLYVVVDETAIPIDHTTVANLIAALMDHRPTIPPLLPRPPDGELPLPSAGPNAV